MEPAIPCKRFNPIFVEVVNSNLTITASSKESYSTGPYKAIDGNLGTRWSSQFRDPQWICIDFGNIISIKGVTLRWEAAYGKSISNSNLYRLANLE